MRFVLFFILVTAFMCGGTAQAADIKTMMEEIKKPMRLKGASERMSVVFNHSSHKGQNCINCHHEVSDKSRYVSCTECHSTPGARERDPMSMYMAYHSKNAGTRSCYGCHNSLTKQDPANYGEKFNGCRPCHTSKMPDVSVPAK